MERVKQALPHQGLAKIAVGLFHQQQVAEIPDVAEHGQIIGRAPGAFYLSGKT